MSFPSTIEPAESAIFLDIRSRVSTAGNEAGLLGLVSDPIFEANGHFYVYYSASGPGWSVVSRVTQRDGVAVPENELVVLEVSSALQQPQWWSVGFRARRIPVHRIGGRRQRR